VAVRTPVTGGSFGPGGYSPTSPLRIA